jgi:hypothetical protein
MRGRFSESFWQLRKLSLRQHLFRYLMLSNVTLVGRLLNRNYSQYKCYEEYSQIGQGLTKLCENYFWKSTDFTSLETYFGINNRSTSRTKNVQCTPLYLTFHFHTLLPSTFGLKNYCVQPVLSIEFVMYFPSPHSLMHVLPTSRIIIVCGDK